MRVILADDHAMVRQGFRAVLEHHLQCEVIGEAATGPEALSLISERRPDVAVVDLMLPGMTGIAVTRAVKTAAPAVAVLIVSMYSDLGYVDAAMRAGAHGYVLKEAEAAVLVHAVREAAAGRRVVSDQLLSYWQADALGGGTDPGLDGYATLTTREREVFAYAVRGASVPHIAAHLTLSVRTVEAYRASLMRKLGVHTQTELVRFAVREGHLSLADPDPSAESHRHR